MCGIVGCRSSGEVAELLVDALKKLEYRGYDSYGFGAVHQGRLSIAKQTGKISRARLAPLPGKIGIAHSRWATHGGVTEANAHPHADCQHQLAVVHNGIVENYQELRRELLARGHRLLSETDSELIPHIIEEYLTRGQHIGDAVRLAFNQLQGRNAIVVISTHSDSVIGARKGSPLIVGIGEETQFIASDIPAFLDHTNKVMYLDDGEMVVLSTPPLFLNLATGQPVHKRVVEIDLNVEQIEKGDYTHFMIKEIMEQKETLIRAINQDDAQIQKIAEAIRQAYGTFFVGCGTAGKVCFTAEYIFSQVAQKHVNFVPGSEFPNFEHFLTDKTLMIAISQSGETADVLEAVETAKKRGVKVVSLVNVPASSLARLSDHTFLINAGPERAVASTKATTSQLALVYLLAYALNNELKEGKKLLIETAAQVNDMLNPRYTDHIRRLAERIHRHPNIYIIGRGLNYPMALESAIKIQEVSYIHAEGFAGGELKHGPIALIDQGTPCIALVANDGVKQETIGNAIEVKSRGGYIIGVAPENNEAFDYWIRVPDAGLASPIVNIIPVQILAYYLGVLRGCDVDMPKNLAKSVTVK